MERSVFNAFVKSWTKDRVECYMIEEKAVRVFEMHSLFSSKKLFKGKQVVFEVTIEPGKCIITCNDVNKSTIAQRLKYLWWRLQNGAE